VPRAPRPVWSGAPLTTDDGGSETQIGGPPPVLLAALGAALLIAVGLIFAFSSLRGSGEEEPDSASTSATRTQADDRVLLTVSVVGSGIGTVQLSPSGATCNSSCEYKFTPDTRVTATVEADDGSTFQGWGDACDGRGRCSFVMDQPRIVSATFAPEPAKTPVCEGVAPEDRDPACPPEGEPGTTTEPIVPGPDCEDAIDNDDDGLTDSAQDPDCETSGSEGGATEPPPSTPPPASTTPSSPPPPPALAPNECLDGEDNDNDGLTDRAQDPDCEKGRSESG